VKKKPTSPKSKRSAEKKALGCRPGVQGTPIPAPKLLRAESARLDVLKHAMPDGAQTLISAQVWAYELAAAFLEALGAPEKVQGYTPANAPIASTSLLAVAEWLTGDDTGISSKYMASVAIAGKVTKSRIGDSTPSDAPDLGRCVRLLEKAPGVREAFPVLRTASPVWAAYVDHWDELTGLFHLGCYGATTARMVALRSSATRDNAKPAR
jgi:hypothetical protein